MLSLLERGREVGRRDMDREGEKRVNSKEDVDVFAVIQKKNTIIPSSRSAGVAG